MIFKVIWGEISKDFGKPILAGTNPPIRFYFEKEEELLMFIKLRGVMLYSSIPKLDLDIKGFKQEFIIGKAYELLEDPKQNKVNLVLKQE